MFEEDKDTGETTVIIEFKDVDALVKSINFLSEPPKSVAAKAEVCFFVSLLVMILF